SVSIAPGENRANERHGESPPLDERLLIERVEQIVKRAHVAREAALQPARRALGQLDAARARAELECLEHLGILESLQLEYGARRPARAEVGQCPACERRGPLSGGDEHPAPLLDLAVQTEQSARPVGLRRHGIDVIEAEAIELPESLERAAAA